MIRPLTLFWFLIAATAVGMVFVISHEVTLRERQLDRMRVEVQKTRDRIHVLRAEWAYLGRPQYLEQMAASHLGLTPIPPERIVELGDLPRPEDRPKEDPAATAKAGAKKPATAPAAVAASPAAKPAVRPLPAAPAAPAPVIPTVPANRGAMAAAMPAPAIVPASSTTVVGPRSLGAMR